MACSMAIAFHSSIATGANPGLPPVSPGACDLNGDGVVNVADVQLAVNQAVGAVACSSADLDGDGSCNVIDVQRIINADLGLGCNAVPSTYQDLYTSLDGYLNAFNTTLNSQWNGSKYPVLFTAALKNADANSGPQMVGPYYLGGVLLQLQALKATGVQGVVVEVGFPMLYAPFFSSESQYLQFVNFYQQVAQGVHKLGLKLIVELCPLRNVVPAGWNTTPFFATLNWDQYQQARAQAAVTVAQTMLPDYLVVLEEPDQEAIMSGQSQVNTVSGATGMLSLMLSSLQRSGVSGVKIGAGVGTWQQNYQLFIESFAAQPVDFIDMHVISVNKTFLPNALTIASIAEAAGKPVTMTQSWLHKLRDSEMGTFISGQILARDPFGFWAPLDAYFLQTMVNLAYYTRMTFIDAFESQYFFASLPYNSSTASLTPSQILSQAIQLANQNIQQGIYASTGLSYYHSIVAPDAIPPSTPTNVAAASGNSTKALLSWTNSTDNVGVAGYQIFRNGVSIATTTQTSYQDTGLTASTAYSYTVIAFDLAGNVSLPSLPASVTTP